MPEIITFDLISDSLSHGRELEFGYRGKLYSVTNSGGNWHFCCDSSGTTVTLCPFDDFDTLVHKVSCQLIESDTIAEIFDRRLYDAGTVYIL